MGFRHDLCEDINSFCLCSHYSGLVFKESDKKQLHSSLGYLTPEEFEARLDKAEEIGLPKLLM